jgi:hypothetical protein
VAFVGKGALGRTNEHDFKHNMWSEMCTIYEPGKLSKVSSSSFPGSEGDCKR